MGDIPSRWREEIFLSIFSVRGMLFSWQDRESFVGGGTDSKERRHQEYTLVPLGLVSTKLSRKIFQYVIVVLRQERG